MLDKNENPFPLIFDFNAPKLFNRYPDASYNTLKEMLSMKFANAPNEFSLGNGSDEVLFNAINALTRPNDTLVTIEPTFGEYKRLAEIRGLVYKPFKLQFPYTVDVDEFIAFAKEINPSLTIICNPNNPTGTTILKENLIKILNHLSGYVIVDEAYIDYGGSSISDVIQHYKNLIVLRTLSKGYGLAGLRFGFSIASQDTTSKIECARAPYNLSMLTVSAVEQLLTLDTFSPQCIEELLKMRASIEGALAENGISFIPSYANFILVKAKHYEKLQNKLHCANIKVRYFDEESTIRFTIGRQEENNNWLEILLSIEVLEG